MRSFMAVIFAAGMFSLAAGEKFLEVDNRFTADGKGCVSGWRLNPDKSFQPLGSMTPVMVDGNPGITLTPAGKACAVFTYQYFPAREGALLKIRADVSGKGSFSAGAYLYTENGKPLGVCGKWLPVSSVRKNVEIAMPLQAVSGGKGIAKMLLYMEVRSGSEVTLSDFRCSITEKGE